MATYEVGYFVGSLAKGSNNRQLSKALIEIPMKGLPLYNRVPRFHPAGPHRSSA